MNLTRRGFFAGGAAFAAAQVLGARAANLRVGILSDVHVDGQRPAENLERALRYFDSRKVDAVLIAGDLVVWARHKEFKLMAETWSKVFPEDCRSDGVRIERLFVTGNHDVDAFVSPHAKHKTIEEAREQSFYFNREKFWREFFHEDYKPVFVKTVKGYTFVLRNWLSEHDARKETHPLVKAADCRPDENHVEEFLAALDLPKEKPFFYVQHEPPRDTVNAPHLIRGERFGNGEDNGISTRFLSKYPNAVAFSGHSHNSLTDELSIWQGAFTAVNCSCNCGFAFTPPGRENGWSVHDFNLNPPLEMDRFDILKVNQGLVMEVFDHEIVLERHDFRNARKVGPDWVIPLGHTAEKPYTIAERIKTAKRPAFRAGATVEARFGEGKGRNAAGTGPASEPHPQIFVSFPAVRMSDGSPVRGWDYAVEAELMRGDLKKTLCERSVFSEGSFYSEEDDDKPVVCAFNRKDVPAKLHAYEKIRFTVTPRSCLGVSGKSIHSPWYTLGELSC